MAKKRFTPRSAGALKQRRKFKKGDKLAGLTFKKKSKRGNLVVVKFGKKSPSNTLSKTTSVNYSTKSGLKRRLVIKTTKRVIKLGRKK